MKTMVLVAMVVLSGCGGAEVVSATEAVSGDSGIQAAKPEAGTCGDATQPCCGTPANAPGYKGTCNAGNSCNYSLSRYVYLCAPCGQIGQPCCQQGAKCANGSQCLTSGGEDVECITQ